MQDVMMKADFEGRQEFELITTFEAATSYSTTYSRKES